MKVKTQVEQIQNVQKLLVKASDAGFIKIFSHGQGYRAFSSFFRKQQRNYFALIQKTPKKKEEEKAFSSLIKQLLYLTIN